MEVPASGCQNPTDENQDGLEPTTKPARTIFFAVKFQELDSPLHFERFHRLPECHDRRLRYGGWVEYFSPRRVRQDGRRVQSSWGDWFYPQVVST